MTTLINNDSAAIQTVAPSLTLGEIQLSADKRSTKETPLTDADRIRRVVLPSNHWGELTAAMNDQRSQGLTDILRAALVKLGSERLKDMLAESPMQRTVAIADFTVAELLKWSEETATSRGSITFTREDAEKWYAASTTKTTREAAWTASGATVDIIKQRHQFLTNRFGALAAKNHGLKDADDVTKLMAMIAPEDASNSVAVEIIGRLQHIEKQMQQKANEATISMGDL